MGIQLWVFPFLEKGGSCATIWVIVIFLNSKWLSESQHTNGCVIFIFELFWCNFVAFTILRKHELHTNRISNVFKKLELIQLKNIIGTQKTCNNIMAKVCSTNFSQTNIMDPNYTGLLVYSMTSSNVINLCFYIFGNMFRVV